MVPYMDVVPSNWLDGILDCGVLVLLCHLGLEELG